MVPPASPAKVLPPDAKPSLLVVVESLDVGGTERHLASVLPAIAAKDLSVSVYTMIRRGTLAASLESSGIAVTSPPLAASLRRLPLLLRRLVLAPITGLCFCWLLWRTRPSIVHFFLPGAYLLGAPVSLLGPRTIRVMSRRSLNEYQRSSPILRRIEGTLHRYTTAFLGNSHAVVAQLKDEGIDPMKIYLIHNGVDPRPYSAARPRHQIREDLRIPDRSVVFVCVANLIPYKGHEDLLRAFDTVKNDMEADCLMLCVGEDRGIQAHLQSLADDLSITNHVRFLGQRHDVPDLLVAADAGVLCSHEEGFSSAILECMAAGLPMVATNVGGNPEAVEDGVTGIVVPPRDPDRLGEAILALSNSKTLRARMGLAGAERAREQFSMKACVGRYREFYGALLEDGRNRLTAVAD